MTLSGKKTKQKTKPKDNPMCSEIQQFDFWKRGYHEKNKNE